jgi:predicted nucleic acid-binding protein
LLDASTWLAAMDQDDRHHRAARALLEAASTGSLTLAALDLTLYEAANVAAVSWRSPQDAVATARLVVLACPDTLVPVDAELVEDAVAIAAEHGLTVYDGAYVAAARRHGWTLVSGDLRDLVRPGLALAPDAVLPEASGSSPRRAIAAAPPGVPRPPGS